MAHDRFVTSTLSELQKTNCSPIDGYQYLSVLTLEQAIEEIIPLVPNIVDHVAIAKKKCNRNSTLLTWHESAAVYLYSMPKPFFSRLNEALRAENRFALKPWFAFLKLFMTALEKLPSTKGTVWRGLNRDDTLSFVDNDVHIWWNINSCSMNLQSVQPFLGETGTLFAIDVIHGKDISAFSAIQDEQEIVLMPGTYVRRKHESLSFNDRLFVLHLEEEKLQSYAFELIKHKYQRTSRVERIMNPSKSFPIEQSYINLAIVGTKEQQGIEKKLLNAKLNSEIIGTYEDIYGAKTKVEVKEIFERCKDQTKKILVLGRAGIGKTTFCRYAAYQWAQGAIWQQYHLVVLIRLRNLTGNRYPPLAPGTNYSPIDLLKKEYFHHALSEKDEKLLREEFDNNQILWLLDGYDEIVHNVPEHLQYLFEQLLETPHHILTSRPYLNTLSYDVQLEITGFTDDNIKEYVEQFFDQIQDEMDDASLHAQKLLSFLQFNPRIWGIVHIPVNLELICSLWCDTDWSETTTMTMTTVYDKMTEWLCRRHLEKQNISSSQMAKEDVYTHCHKELAFLESLAFNGMKSNSIIIRPKLLRIASIESKCSLQHQPHLLNIGILKSLDYKPIGTHIEADKDHYFVHLSFQEHFAARYLVRALNNSENQKKKAIDFIKAYKYDQRFELVLTFASGLLTDYDAEQRMNSFWEGLSGEPVDLVGLRHVSLIISCIEETNCNRNIPRFSDSMNLIIQWIGYSVTKKNGYLLERIVSTLHRSSSLVNQPSIIDTLVKLHQNKDPDIKSNAYLLITQLPISNSQLNLAPLHLAALNDVRGSVREKAYKALNTISDKATTNEVIDGLLIALEDTDISVRHNAFEALGNMGGKAATNEVIDRLLIALGDQNSIDRVSACETLGNMGEKAATKEVIDKLLIALDDRNNFIRERLCQVLGNEGKKEATKELINQLLIAHSNTNDRDEWIARHALARIDKEAAAIKVINQLLIPLYDENNVVRIFVYKALGNMGERAITNEVINRLLIALWGTDNLIRTSAWEALQKMGKKAATNEVINTLLIALEDTNALVGWNACEALENTGKKAATNEVINRLLIALGDINEFVRKGACQAMRNIGEKAATNEVINRLLIALDDQVDLVRASACQALGNMGEKAVTNEVIDRLLIALDDRDDLVRTSVCQVLGNMGEKAATNEVINRLFIALGDIDVSVREEACRAIRNIGETAVTNKVIDRLLIALGDINEFVRKGACQAIRNIGEKAATNEVINRLLIALGDQVDLVRASACQALGNMGEKAVTNEVIDRLLIALDDRDDLVRTSVCQALGKMGEKAATNEVINRLFIALGDIDVSVREEACRVIRNIGEAAATNEVINRLLIALDDQVDLVRAGACQALGNMGEKAATNQVINRLLIALDDQNKFVSDRAWNVFRKMNEKAATNEGINRLLIALESKNESIRQNACKALGDMKEKAAVHKIISKLLVALGDTSDSVKKSACKALGGMGEKAATKEVINKLLVVLSNTNVAVGESMCEGFESMDDGGAMSYSEERVILLYLDDSAPLKEEVREAVENILPLSVCMSDLEMDTVLKLSMHRNLFKYEFWRKISREKVVRAFLDTKIPFWLPIIKEVLIKQGCGITVAENNVVVYGSKEPVELCFLDRELGQQLYDHLKNCVDKLFGRCE